MGRCCRGDGGLASAQVALREFTSFTFVGAGELTRFMLICVVFVTLPYVLPGVSIRMDELTSELRGVWRRACAC